MARKRTEAEEPAAGAITGLTDVKVTRRRRERPSTPTGPETEPKRPARGKGRKPGPGSHVVVNAIDNERIALEFRKQGHPYWQIGNQLGMTEEGARQCVLRALKRLRETVTESSIEVLEMELGRLDDMWKGLEKRARSGDVFAVDRCLRIQDRRAKYLGLDAAIRAELSGPGGGPVQVDLTGLSDEQLAAVYALMKAGGAAVPEATA